MQTPVLGLEFSIIFLQIILIIIFLHYSLLWHPRVPELLFSLPLSDYLSFLNFLLQALFYSFTLPISKKISYMFHSSHLFPENLLVKDVDKGVILWVVIRGYRGVLLNSHLHIWAPLRDCLQVQCHSVSWCQNQLSGVHSSWLRTEECHYYHTLSYTQHCFKLSTVYFQ